jgi:NHL repeat
LKTRKKMTCLTKGEKGTIGEPSPRKGISAALVVACLISVATAADHPTTSVARPDVIVGPPMPVLQFVRPRAMAAAGEKIFVSDYIDNVVNIYDKTGKQLGQLTGFSEPQGLAINDRGNLYVADTANSRIQVYAPPYTGSPTTLSDSGWYPADVATYIKGKDTWVAASNICSAQSCTQGGFTIYENGVEQTPFQSPSIYRVYFLDFDAKGNLYADGLDSSDSIVVGEIPGATNGQQTFNVLATGNTIEFPGGVQVTSKSKIAIDDQDAYAVYTYDPPVSGSLGSPIATTSLSGASDPVTIDLKHTRKDLWVADVGLSQANEFAYPAGGSPIHSISISNALGAAVARACSDNARGTKCYDQVEGAQGDCPNGEVCTMQGNAFCACQIK